MCLWGGGGGVGREGGGGLRLGVYAEHSSIDKPTEL